jgi:hypothetical protein
VSLYAPEIGGHKDAIPDDGRACRRIWRQPKTLARAAQIGRLRTGANQESTGSTSDNEARPLVAQAVRIPEATRAIPRTEKSRKGSANRVNRRGEGKLHRRKRSVFLNVPYDKQYEPLFLAFIAGLSGFGLAPRATIEISGSQRRLDRILELIDECSYSFHDLSRVTLSRTIPRAPRFNVPFELGLSVAKAAGATSRHRWFVFEARAHRLNRTLSDLDGTDPYIHNNKPGAVLRGVMNALVQHRKPPTLRELESMYRELRAAASKLKKELGNPRLFEARAFVELVLVANDIASRRLS